MARGKNILGYIPVVAIICLGVGLSIMAFTVRRQSERRAVELQLERTARDHISILRQQTELHLLELESLEAFFAGSVEVERDEFAKFVNIFLRVHSDVHALAWAPRVLASQRKDYEQAAKQNGLSNFQITEITQTADVIAARSRDEYFPVFFIEPLSKNLPILGLDLSSNSVILEALNKSRDSGQQVATGRLSLMKSIGEDFVFLVLQPVYFKSAATDSEQDRHANLQGFVVGFFHAGEILESVLANLDIAGIDFYMYDNSAPQPERLMYTHISRIHANRASSKNYKDYTGGISKGEYYSETINIADRKWLILCSPAAGYIEASKTAQPWWNLSVGLLLTGVLSSYLLSATRRTEHIERTVKERTAELEKEVAERKRAELALRMSEQCFRAIADYTYFWEIWVSPMGRPLWTNPAVYRVTGYSIDQLMVMQDYPIPLIYEEDRDRIARAFKSAVRGSTGNSVEFRIRRKDGTVIWADMSWQPIYDEKGVSQGHRTSIRDITDRKQAEQALQESERRYRELLKNIPQKIFYKNLNSVFLLCNESFARDLNIEPDEMIGKTDYDFFPDELAEKYRADDKRIIQSGIPEEVEEEYLKDGQKFIVRTSKAPVKDKDGNIIGIFGIFWDITQRKQAEQELREREQRYRELVETMNEGLGVADADYKFTYVNQRLTQMLGYSFDQMIGRHVTEFLDEENKKIMQEQIAKRHSGQAETFDLTWTANDGRKVYTIASPKAIFDSQGNFQGSFGVLTDITEREQAEAEISRLAKFPDENPNPVLRISADGTVLYTNRAGWPLLNIWQCKVTEHIPPQWHKHVLDAINSGKPVFANAKCGDRIFSLVFAPVVDADYVNIYALDITELEQARQQLRTARDDWENIFESISDMVLILDTDQRIVDANRSAISALNLPKEKIIGRFCYELFHCTDHSPGLCPHRKLLSSKRPETTELEMQVFNGVYLVTVAPVFDLQGKILKTIHIAKDITERRHAAQEREQLMRTLALKNEELESILFVASHDLRSPLVNIQGFSHELSRTCDLIRSALENEKIPADIQKQLQNPLNQSLPEALSFILTSVNKMDSLLSGLLRLSRLGQAAMKIETLDMNTIIADVADSMEYLIEQAGAVVKIDPLPDCLGDASQINQVFSNLLDNALKYLDDSRKGMIHIYGKVELAQSIYCVEDNGVGIEPAYQDKIFEIFQRLDPDKKPGQGLGLTIVRRILDMNNGKILVESEPGKASRFFVSLPNA